MTTITITKSIITITNTTSIGVEHPYGSGHPVSPHFGSFRQCRLLCCKIFSFLSSHSNELPIKHHFRSHVNEMSCIIWYLYMMAALQISLLILSALLTFKKTTHNIHMKRILTYYVCQIFNHLFCNCLFLLKVSPALYFLGIAEFREILLGWIF